MARAKAKNSGKKGKQAKLSKGKKKRVTKKKVAAKRKAAPRPRATRKAAAESTSAVTEIAEETTTPSASETLKEPATSSSEMGVGDGGINSTKESTSTSM